MVDQDRLERISHYICALFDNRPKLDATLLNRIILYSDLCALKIRGFSITKAIYCRQPHGLVPDGMAQTLNTLLYNRKIEQQIDPLRGLSRIQLVSIKKPDLNMIAVRDRGILEIAAMIAGRYDYCSSRYIVQIERIWMDTSIGDEVSLLSCLSNV